MTQAMNSRSASSELTKSFDVSIGNNASAVTATVKIPCVVINYEDRVCPAIKTPAKHQSIDDLIAELSSDADFRDELKKARSWVVDEFYAEDGDTIRTLRLNRGWSQTQLAEKLKTSQSHVTRIERGTENLSTITCRRLCEVFEIDMNTLDAMLRRQETILAGKKK
jgi:DNA-binding XRE family transcriptional regulator